MRMPENSKTARILALAGTILLWIPIVFMIVTSLVVTVVSGIFRMDYLIPAELFPVEFGGALLLLWAAIRAKSYKKPVGWGIIIMAASFVLGNLTAVLTGLAEGRIGPSGPEWAAVLTLILLYTVAAGAMGVCGILLFRKLFAGRK